MMIIVKSMQIDVIIQKIVVLALFQIPHDEEYLTKPAIFHAGGQHVLAALADPVVKI